MIFTLEALQAEKGDSLILHYGDPDAPEFIVIDGGPDPVYTETLKPRLEQLHEKFQDPDDGQIDIRMVMVSHIDDDHINGIQKWFNELVDLKDNNESSPYNIQTLWFNSFDELLSNDAMELPGKVAEVASTVLQGIDPGVPMKHETAAVIASVRQGRRLRAQAETLGVKLNKGVKEALVMGIAKQKPLKLSEDVRLHILAPSQARLEDLQKQWATDIRAKKDISPAEVAEFLDKSVANLSSIVVLAEAGSGNDSKTMLLTGDARGDEVMAGLELAGLLKPGGTIHVDLFKVPHHGSNRNSALELFQRITADNYVISANGEHSNPDPEIFEWLAEARGNDKYKLFLTNEKMVEPNSKTDVRALMDKALKANPSPNRSVFFRSGKLSMKVDLMDKVGYLTDCGAAPASEHA